MKNKTAITFILATLLFTVSCSSHLNDENRELKRKNDQLVKQNIEFKKVIQIYELELTKDIKDHERCVKDLERLTKNMEALADVVNKNPFSNSKFIY
jgi:hypothetical protein